MESLQQQKKLGTQSKKDKEKQNSFIEFTSTGHESVIEIGLDF